MNIMPSSDTQFKKGNKIGPRFKKGYPSWNKGIPRSKETKRKISETKKARNQRPPNCFYSGEKHPNWKGGISPLVERIRRNFKYRQWRSDVFTKDNFICQECGYDKGRILQVHHLKPFIEIIRENNIKILEEALNCEELWDINNGITLCKKCHKVKRG